VKNSWWRCKNQNNHKLDRLPEKLRENIFEKVFLVAEIAKLSRQEYLEYEDSLKVYRDLLNSIDTAHEEGIVKGKAEGKAEGKTETAINMLANGEPMEKIAKYAGLTQEQIEPLRNKGSLPNGA
jgi:predicted transposase/invertase (TIGR01784 family)